MMKKKSKRHKIDAFRDYNKINDEVECFIHQSCYSQTLPLRNLTENALRRIKNASEIRKDEYVINALNGVEDLEEVSLKFHQKCFDNYTHSGALKRIEENSRDTDEDSEIENESLNESRRSSRKRDRAGRILADQECCICFKKKTIKRSGYEPLTRLDTETAATTLKDCAVTRNDNQRLLAYVSGVDWKSIVPLELHYHRTCYRSYTRREKLNNTAENDEFEEIFQYVSSRIFVNFEVVMTEDVWKVFNQSNQIRRNITKNYLVDQILKKFEPKIAYWSPTHGKSFFFNNQVEKGRIIEVLTRELDLLNQKQNHEMTTKEKIEDLASVIRDELNETPETFDYWPPNEDDLIGCETIIPPSLFDLVKKITHRKTKLSERKNTRIRSLCQDIMYCYSNGNSRTKKHVLLSLCVKRKTGSKEVLAWINRLGNGISYDEVSVLETHLAQMAILNQSLKSFCPRNVCPSTFVTFVWDNNDVNPESIFGRTMHCTNGIIIQMPSDEVQSSEPVVNSVSKSRTRSFKPVNNEIAKYTSRERASPDVDCSNVALRIDEIASNFKDSCQMDLVWILLRYINQKIPGWTGFNYLVYKHEMEKEGPFHQVHYLPAINDSPTKNDVVLELLQQSKIKAEHLGLQETDVVLDQAIYAKAVEILSNPVHSDLRKFIVLRMGAFHTTCIFLGVIGKRFGDAGLRDWILESDLIGKGSVDKVLNGKHYNFCLRIYKCLYYAITRMRIESLSEWLDDQSIDLMEKFSLSKEVHDCIQEPEWDTLMDVIGTSRELLKKFEEHANLLKDESTFGPTATFWFSFIEMMDTLLTFLRTIKIGHWQGHLCATRKMLPWFFCYDKPNYSRFISLYLTDMLKLPDTHPNIHQQFMQGNFSVQRSKGSFNQVASDQCIEQTINREQKCHGGIKGYSTSEGTIQRWVLTSHCVSQCISSLRMELMWSNSSSTPKDLRQSRRDFNNKSATMAFEVLQNWGNPFEKRESLINICSGVEASEEITRDLIKANELGEAALQKFWDDRIKSKQADFYSPIKKMNLKSFKNMTVKKKIKLKEKSIVIAAERSMFARLLTIAQSRGGLTLRQILTYSLSPIPWALGLPDGSYVKTTKSKLLSTIESVTVNPSIESPSGSVRIYDGMVLLQKLEKVNLPTFGDVSSFLLKKILSHSQVAYFVTDQYNDGSIKSFERARRSDSGTIRIRIERREQQRPKQWPKYLRDGSNKTELISFLLKDWSSNRFTDIMRGKTLYVNCNSSFFKLTCEQNEISCEEEPDLATEQEEADTKVFFCAKHAQSSAYQSAVIETVDTDIAIYALYFQCFLEIELFLNIGTGNKKRLLDISNIMTELGEDCCLALPALHCFSGNDYTSAFYGIGKAKAYKVMMENQEFVETFKSFGETFIFDGTLFPSVQKFVCRLYAVKTESVNEGRYMKFCSKKRTPEPQQLPPTADALVCHCKRVSYATAIIKKSLVNTQVPGPDTFGWSIDGEMLEIQWMLIPPAPDIVLNLVNCSCKKSMCKNRMCACKSHGLKCTDLCACNELCENGKNGDEESDGDSDEDSDLDEDADDEDVDFEIESEED